MTDRPIIFSSSMVLALLAGRKTMTRRLAWRPDGKPSLWQKVRPGDRLWVKESHYVWAAGNKDGSGRRIDYRASSPDAPCIWTISRYMPRFASRLTLTVTAARIERLQDIDIRGAQAEGIDVGPLTGEAARRAFADLWNTLHGPDAWAANPEVVALAFTVERRNIDATEMMT